MSVEENLDEFTYPMAEHFTMLSRIVRRAIVFRVQEARHFFGMEVGPDIMLCVSNGSNRWVTSLAEAEKFYKE